MLTFAEINGAVQATKVLYDIIKTNKELANYNELSSAVSEVYAKLMSATGVALASQEKQAALSDRIRELEQQLMELENWQHEAERYQLTELCTGVFVRSLKPSMANSEPQHNICAACYNKKQKGYLHKTDFSIYGTKYKCDRCGFELLDDSNKKPQQPIPTSRMQAFM